VVERPAERGRPQADQDRELLLKPVEPLADLREREPICGMLGLVPAGAEAEFHPATRHPVELGDLDREDTRKPERHRADQRAEPDRPRLAGQAGQHGERIRRARQAVVVVHRQVVIGQEEAAEARVLGQPRQPQLLVVGGAELGAGEQTHIHARRP
jgi:hypothetical protein